VPNEPDLIFLLHDLARQLRVAGDRRARAHGMTRAQWVILWWLERQPGLSQKELAALMDVEPITVARLVDRLAARGMVERRDDPADRRIWRLHLLPPAMPVLEHMRGVRDEFQRILAGDVPAATLAGVAHALAAMKANLADELRTRPERPPEAVAEPAPKPRAPARRRGASASRAGAAPEPAFHQDHP
jgi:DNA-binding MarR family transcriptional regulator